MAIPRIYDGSPFPEQHWETMATAVEALQATAPAFAAVVPAYKTADETINNSAAFQDDDHIAGLSLPANAVCIGRLVMSYIGSPVADLKWQLVFSTAATIDWSASEPQATTSAGGSAPTETTIRFQSAQGASLPSGGVAGCHATGGGTALPVRATVDFVLAVGATAGTLKLQWAQNTANASDLIMLRGTLLHLGPRVS